jgi:hypothetical protein
MFGINAGYFHEYVTENSQFGKIISCSTLSLSWGVGQLQQAGAEASRVGALK